MKYNYLVLTNDRDFIYISDIISISTFSKLFIKKAFGDYSELLILSNNYDIFYFVEELIFLIPFFYICYLVARCFFLLIFIDL